MEGQDMVNSIDRLSALPDTILTHILSFLPTKLSVRSSVLARRWRYLWTEVPTLDFDRENEDIIGSVMSQHKLQAINTFRLTSKENYNFRYYDDAWINAAIDRNVQNIYLFLFETAVLPRRLFSCKTLVDLRINSYFVVPHMGDNVCLACLKILHITSVTYEDGGETLVNLLSGCPVLEELVIGLVTDNNLVSCNISSPTIKRLTVHFMFGNHVTRLIQYLFHQLNIDGDLPTTSRRFYNHDYKIEINTPALEYLRILDCLSEQIESGALTSLTEADVYLHNAYMKQDDVHYSQSVLEFIDRLSNVKYLKLDLSYCTEVGEDINGWTEPQRVPTCLGSHLRTIMLVNIVGTKHDFEIVRYLLRNAKVLERMEISYPMFHGYDEKIYVVREISQFERASEACELSFAEFV